MLLSEAIRKGSGLRPQGFGAYFTQNERREVCSCAIGAAIEGATGRAFTDGIAGSVALKKDKEIVKLLHGWGLIVRYNPGNYSRRQWRIANMNDGQRMSREEIASVLESEGL